MVMAMVMVTTKPMMHVMILLWTVRKMCSGIGVILTGCVIVQLGDSHYAMGLVVGKRGKDEYFLLMLVGSVVKEEHIALKLMIA